MIVGLEYNFDSRNCRYSESEMLKQYAKLTEVLHIKLPKYRCFKSHKDSYLIRNLKVHCEYCGLETLVFYFRFINDSLCY